MKSLYIKIIQKFAFLTLCFSIITINSVFSQINDNKNEVTVIASYEPSLSDAFKINFNPVLKDSIFELPAFDYKIQTKIYPTSFSLDPIKPAKIVGEPITKLYKNLIKVGMGTYTTPYFEFFAGSLRSKKYSMGVHLKHISSSGKIDEYAKSSYSDNYIGLFGNRYYNNSNLAGEILFNREVVHYYGFKPSDFPTYNYSDEDIRQRFTKFSFNTNYYSTYTDSNKLNHNLALSFNNISDKFDAKENNIKLNAGLDVNFKLFNFDNKQTLGLNLLTDFYNHSNSISEGNNSAIFGINPFFKTNFHEYKIKAGINTAITTSSGMASKLNIFPDIELRLNIIEKVLSVFAGFTGGIERNSLSKLTDENPYVKSDIATSFQKNKIEIYAGINTGLTKSIDFSASISNSSIEGIPLFVNDTNDITRNKFDVIYDKVTRLKVNSQLLFKYDDKLNFALEGNIYRYSTDTETEAWHKPTIDLTFSTRYNIRNKIIARADIYAFNKMYAKNYVNNIMVVEEIKGAVDFNLGIEYRYSKILSGFINLNNIGALRYQNWYNYPNHRFSLLAGLSYAF